ncbi:MAG: hypothetical protein J5736_05425 [Bacilli bacterium]|nr:hypothetical protein [Bacilli bacterium]
MIELYDINQGLELLKKRKVLDVFTLAALLPLGGISAVLIVFGFAVWMAILFAILWFSYAAWTLAYLMFFRKRWNQRYHFLAKVEQFDRRASQGQISAVAENAITNEGMSFVEIRFESDVFFVEADKANLFSVGMKCRIAAVDGVIIAYEKI